MVDREVEEEQAEDAIEGEDMDATDNGYGEVVWDLLLLGGFRSKPWPSPVWNGVAATEEEIAKPLLKTLLSSSA